MTNEGDRKSRFYSCSCFTTDNIFLKDYKLHVRFVSEQQFRLEYQPLLTRLGCVREQQFVDVLSKVSQEVDRRRHICETSAERTAAIKNTYQPLHPHVYHLQESYLAPKLKQIVEYCRSSDACQEGLAELLEDVGAPRVYRLPVFEKSFCKELVEELDHFEESSAPKGRPNTMNNYGVPLSETECTEVEHRVTEGLLHRGQHMHGALPISCGQRWNLIIWMRASQERNKLCPMCNRSPSLMEAYGFADGFTKQSEA